MSRFLTVNILALLSVFLALPSVANANPPVRAAFVGGQVVFVQQPVVAQQQFAASSYTSGFGFNANAVSGCNQQIAPMATFVGNSFIPQTVIAQPVVVNRSLFSFGFATPFVGNRFGFNRGVGVGVGFNQFNGVGVGFGRAGIVGGNRGVAVFRGGKFIRR